MVLRSHFKYFVVFFVFLILYALSDVSDSYSGPFMKERQFPNFVCALYQGGFGNEAIDGEYRIWGDKGDKYYFNKKVMPFEPMLKAFPSLGLYSSHDESVIKTHFLMMRQAGIDAAILLWEGQNHTDKGYTDRTLQLMFKNAKEYDIKIGIQIVPYKDNSNETVYEDIKYYVDTYGDNEMMLKVEGKPFVIIYEPFYIKHFFEVLKHCRGTKYDCFFVSTMINLEQIGELLEDDFDAVFTYFASESFKPSSDIKNWKELRQKCDDRGMGLIAAVSPGYNDQKNSDWTLNIDRKREDGRYYDNMWRAAIEANADIVIVNSFNCWEQGTNIEPANNRAKFLFDDDSWHSSSKDSFLYIKKTAEWIEKFNQR